MPREKIVRGRDLRLVSASVLTTRDNSSEREIKEIQSTITDIKQEFQELKDAGYELKDEKNDKVIDIKTGKSKRTITRYNTRQVAAQDAAKKRLENIAMKTTGTTEEGKPFPQVLIATRKNGKGEEVGSTPSPAQMTPSSANQEMASATNQKATHVTPTWVEEMEEDTNESSGQTTPKATQANKGKEHAKEDEGNWKEGGEWADP